MLQRVLAQMHDLRRHRNNMGLAAQETHLRESQVAGHFDRAYTLAQSLPTDRFHHRWKPGPLGESRACLLCAGCRPSSELRKARGSCPRLALGPARHISARADNLNHHPSLALLKIRQSSTRESLRGSGHRVHRRHVPSSEYPGQARCRQARYIQQSSDCSFDFSIDW